MRVEGQSASFKLKALLVSIVADEVGRYRSLVTSGRWVRCNAARGVRPAECC
jgi:hypothetical protein